MSDGIYGMRADGALTAESSERHAALTEEHRRLHTALNEVAQYNAVPPEEGQWDGGRIEDVYDDFAVRYAFAFWRLSSQGITTITSPREQDGLARQLRSAARPADPDVRVIRLAHQVPEQRSEKSNTSRVYHHR